MAGGREELRREILRLIAEDKEFRLAVAGAIGLAEILERLEALERRVEEHSRVLQQHSKTLQEHSKRLEELTRRLEDLARRVEEHSRRLEELTRRVEEHSRVLREHSMRLEELTRAVEALARRVSRLEEVTGALAESMYSKSTLELVLEEARAAGERVESWRRNARLDGEDIDLLVVTDRSVYVVEVKVKPKQRHVGEVLVKAELASRRYPVRRVVAILAGARVGREVEDLASSKGVRVYSW
jgi:archaellum component FlaC